ncbi:hypothetical protein SVA_0632 [Sulfurifustis variabilis]|uniref:DUF3311 domain-containing protein n=1 Tax=Sulfurifustis variabilis TaxID=1675686 RepID=A0A1B4VAS8_9GAMM|nr:hypothetical protein [Sulfurifustis variabilis]BAU47211.1 hypothetical protein SVA_0632 [Sulfurifustis variabilis]
MQTGERTGERLVGLALAGVVALNYPLLHLFSGAGTFLGIPSLYFYLFFVWAALIALMAVIMRARPEPGRDGAPPGNTDDPGGA